MRTGTGARRVPEKIKVPQVGGLDVKLRLKCCAIKVPIDINKVEPTSAMKFGHWESLVIELWAEEVPIGASERLVKNVVLWCKT